METTRKVGPPSMRWLHRALMLTGAILLASSAASLLESGLYGTLQAWRLDKILEGTAGSHRGEGGLAVAAAARAEAAGSGLIGRIQIPRVGVDAIVTEGADGATLRRSVGHVAGTAYPGEAGNVVLAGHRETHFRGLRRVRPGDTIRITSPDGVFGYRVKHVAVVDPDRVDLLEADAGADLTLITCYPFHYVGPAPRRFVVQARLIDAGSAGPAR